MDMINNAAMPGRQQTPMPLKQLQDKYMELKFGMFLHFNIATFNERGWANGYEDPNTFAPALLDCNQWAETADLAGMKYAILTVKHTGGWCLWDSIFTTHDMTAFKNFKKGSGDIAREFVDAFRRRNIKVGFYYCFPGDYDNKHGNILPEGKSSLHGMPQEAQGDYVGFILKQIKELLTSYGNIDVFWVDQYMNKYITRANWLEIKNHIKCLQPNCLVIANNAHDFQLTDIHSYELPISTSALPPVENTESAEVCDVLGTHNWFWDSSDERSTKSAVEVIDVLKKCNSRRANYLLNVAPDKTGLIPAYTVRRLREIRELLNGRYSATRRPHGLEE